jgi:hypothetical protein
MPSYLINYQVISDRQVVVEAASEEHAFDMVFTSEIDDFEPEVIMQDVFADTIDISEVSE